jgi:hypothetical protein
MEMLVGSCGIECDNCPAFIATKNNDEELRKSTAEKWSRMFNANLEAKDINCMGCHSDVLFSYCTSCDIRDCNTSKGNENCSKCSDYTCDKIEEFFKTTPEAKTVLDALNHMHII